MRCRGLRIWAGSLSMAAAYYAVGSLSLLLAIPPGYATAVWPASGIALAGVLLLGGRVWPGIVLGSFAVNVWTSLDATSLRTLAASSAIAVSIGLGASLQAVLGALLVRRFAGYPTQFLRDRDVLRFLLLGGPVACLTNSVWGVTTLLVAGVIGVSDYVFHWWTWWVGDTIGVITVAPLVLVWLTEAGKVAPRRRAAITVPLALAFVLVVSFFALSSAWERDRVRLEFGRRTDELARTLARSLEGDIEVLYSIQSFFASSGHVDRAEFHTFVTRLLARHQGLQALSWNPRIRDSERATYEQRARGEGLADFRITELDAQQNLVPAAPRPEHVVVYFIEPRAGNEAALGFDVASDPVRRAALDRARLTGTASATEPIVLVQARERSVGFLAVLPIHASRRTSAAGEDDVLGYATGVFRIADIVAAALEGANTSGLRMQLFDATAPGRPSLLYDGLRTVESTELPTRVIPVDVAGRRWELRFALTREYLIANRSWLSWGVLAVGMLFTGLLGAFLLMITGRAGQLQAVNNELRGEIAERRRAERDLREAEESAALILAEALDAVITIDLDGVVTSWNPQAERLFGWTEREIQGRRLTETIIPPEHRDAHERGLAHFRETGEGPILGRRLELTARRRDGTTFPIELTVTRVMIRGRVAFSAFVRDISERKLAEASLARYAKRVGILHAIDRALIAGEGPEAIGAGVLQQVRDLLDVPRVMVILFDLAAGEAEWLAAAGRRRIRLGRGVRYSLSLAGDLEALRRGEPQVIDVGRLPDSPETQALLASDVRVYMVVPMLMEGELIGGLSFGGPSGEFPPEQVDTAREIATQMGIAIAQARLRGTKEVSESRYRALVEGSIQGMYITGSDLRIRYANAAMAAMFGFPSPADVVGRSALDLYAPADRETIEQRVLARFRGEPVSNRYEVQGIRTDGTPIWLDLLLSRIAVDGEVQTQVVLVDITERKRTEERLRQAQKMEAIGRLAGGVAHDFNNLLTVIMGRSQILLQRMPGGAPGRDSLELILKTSERGAQLTRQLLAFSRQQILEPRIVNVGVIVAGLEPMLRRLIGEDVDLVVRAAPDLGRTEADAGQLEQVVLNLVVNSRDAMPTGGRLVVETANADLDARYAAEHPDVSPGAYVSLRVSDTGMGMDAATRARLFEPFFTTKPAGKGTGLGLATVYGIVTQSGGHVAVESEPGRGTTFTVYLPRTDAPAEVPDAVASAAASAGGDETILMVEDDPDLRELAVEIVTDSGYTVLQAGSPEEALQVAARHAGSIDLLLTDIVMPGIGGRELSKRLLAARPDMKVLFMSGYTADAIVLHGVAEHETAMLQKPFGPAALLEKIREVLR